MKAGTMEGLIGANINMKMTDTPMRVYKEARRKGDLATMERSMGYAGDFTQKANEYKDMAEEELRKEMKEARKEEELRQEEAARKRREEAEKFREELLVNADDKEDSVAISEEGRKILAESDLAFDPTAKPEYTETKLYSSDGKAVETGVMEGSVSISV